jgi:site-specific DNA-methyltransferase (adenine-specific)
MVGLRIGTPPIEAIDCRCIDWDTFGVMITDPPYSENVHRDATSCATTAKNPGPRARKRDLGFDSISAAMFNWTCRMAAKVERWSCIFTDIESVGAYKAGIEAAGGRYVRAMPWVRWSMPQLSGDRPPQGCEMVVLAYGKGRGKKHWNGPGNNISFNQLALRGKGKHKCEKPLDLMLTLVEWFSDEKEMVIDPFAGSGTTGLACAVLGRRFQGTECDTDWAIKGSNRIYRGTDFTLRDKERYDRWLEASLKVKADKARLAAHTAKIRARFEAKDAT